MIEEIIPKKYSVIQKDSKVTICTYINKSHYEKIFITKNDCDGSCIKICAICVQEHLSFFSNFRIKVPGVKFELHFWGTYEELETYLKLYFNNHLAIFDLAKISTLVEDRPSITTLNMTNSQIDLKLPKRFQKKTIKPAIFDGRRYNSFLWAIFDRNLKDYKIFNFPIDESYPDLVSNLEKILCVFDGTFIYYNYPVKINLHHNKNSRIISLDMKISDFVIANVNFDTYEKKIINKNTPESFKFFLHFLYHYNFYNDFIIQLQKEILRRLIIN